MSSAPKTNQRHASVLIVGAGPVGLTAAIRLREEGVAVRIIDELTAEAKRTYPVVIHPRTLRILASLGVSAPLEWRGRAITHLALYTDAQRRAVLELPAAGEVSPGAMTLPQDVLRQALMRRLSELGTEVEWKTRLVALDQKAGRPRAGIVNRQRVEGEAPALKPEWLDVASESLEVEFVIGADGCRSSVRQALGIEWVAKGRRQLFAFYDAPDYRAGDEAHLVLVGDTVSSVYPLQGAASRFTFQLDVGMGHAPGLTELQQLLEARLPWYAAHVERFEWSGMAEFHPALADRFGEGRVWLAGDAAHSTGPIGGQSLNVGIHEAEELARQIIEQMSHANASARPLGPSYGQQRRLEWHRLFGLGSSRPQPAGSPDWVKHNVNLLLPSLPAAGDDLDDLLEQLHVASA
jgi:2-polyprenyl-6-methoxyphenol hydroxylase-like FAD-dependent oxidoreductase